jgi:hypothetical protein
MGACGEVITIKCEEDKKEFAKSRLRIGQMTAYLQCYPLIEILNVS